MNARFWTGTKMTTGLVVAVLVGASASLAQAPGKPGVTEPRRDSSTAPQPDADVLAHVAGLPKEAEVFANRPGLCLDLGCGDGTLAAEIARKTKYTVFAVAKDDADCEKTRQTRADAGHFFALVDGVYYTAEGDEIVALDAATGHGPELSVRGHRDRSGSQAGLQPGEDGVRSEQCQRQLPLQRRAGVQRHRLDDREALDLRSHANAVRGRAVRRQRDALHHARLLRVRLPPQGHLCADPGGRRRPRWPWDGSGNWAVC